MIDYLYDGSFEGLLSCVYFHYYDETASGIFVKSRYQSDLLRPCREVTTHIGNSDKVYNAILEKISKQALQNVYHVYLSNFEKKEMLILNYLIKGFKVGKSIDFMHSDTTVHQVHLYARKVTAESHRFLGLIRFADAGGFLYAVFEPDHDILALLGDHFANRLRNEKFIIHDRKRLKALIYSDENWYITDFIANKDMALSTEEDYYRSLWKSYFQHIGISERKNPRLQAQYMPKRYWKHLTEISC